MGSLRTVKSSEAVEPKDLYSSATALANSLTLMSFLTNNTNNQSIMKKIWIYMISLAIFAGLFSACKKESKDNDPDVKPVATSHNRI